MMARIPRSWSLKFFNWEAGHFFISMETTQFAELQSNFEKSQVLYYFPITEGVCTLFDRIKICDQQSFDEFLTLPVPRPKLYIFKKEQSSHSPLLIPGAEMDTIDTYSSHTSFISNSSKKSSSSTRDPIVAEQFREAVFHRDGKICLICKDDKSVDAAHVYPFHPDTIYRSCELFELASDAILYNVNNVCNGITLCKMCHGQFDHGLWNLTPYEDIDYNARPTKFYIFVSDALQKSTHKHNEHWAAHVGAEFIFPSRAEFYPKAIQWYLRREYCQKAQQEREANRTKYPFSCDKCGKGYKTNGYHYVNHLSDCIKIDRAPLTTPRKELTKVTA